MKPAPFRYAAPTTVEEVCDLTAHYGDRCKVLAGGQSLGPLLNLRLAAPDVLIDLGRIRGLTASPSHHVDALVVTAMTTQHTAAVSPLVREHVPLLTEALPYVAHRTIRNRGTIGGSVAHADPSAEIPAVAVAAGATFTIRNAEGERVIAANDFFDGFFTTALEPDDLLTSISFPVRHGHDGSCWMEFAPRRGDFAIVGVAVVVRIDGGNGTITQCRITYSGVSDRPWTDPDVGAIAIGERPSNELFVAIAQAAAAACSPLDDAVASAVYRRNLVRHLTATALGRAVSRIGQGT